MLKKIKKLFTIDNIWWIGILLITLIIHASHLLDSDEGVVLAIARDILNGKKLYVDIFQFTSPGVFYLIALIWKIFGASYFVARFTASIAVFIGAIGLYKIAYHISKNKLSLFIPLFFVLSTLYWPLIIYHTFNLTCTIWAIYFVIKLIDELKLKYAIYTGISVGLAIIFLQHTGIALLGCIGFFIFIIGICKKQIFYFKSLFALTFPAIFIPCLMLLYWSPITLFKNLIEFPFFNYTEIAKVPYTLIYAFLLFLILIIWINRKKRKISVYFLFFIQFVLLFSTTPLADHFHVTKFLFPIYTLIPFTLDRAQKENLIIKSSFIIFTFTAMLFILWPSVYRVSTIGLFYDIDEFDLIPRINEICKDSEYIYAGPFIPNYYFELNKKNPSKHVWLITNHHTEEHFIEMRDGIEKYQPKCAILFYNMVDKYHYNQDNPVDNYIKENYSFYEKIYGVSIYTKK